MKNKKCKRNSLEKIVGNLKMELDLDQVNLNEQPDIDEIVNFNLLNEIREKIKICD
jgi:hypothetical protein